MKYVNKDIFDAMEKWAPKSLAYDWDNVGLQVGSYFNNVRNILISLDVLELTVDEAIKHNIDLIIAHHPILFTGIKELNYDTPKGRTLKKIIENNISVYAAHTNLDIAVGGVNDLLCERLNLTDVVPLEMINSTGITELINANKQLGIGRLGCLKDEISVQSLCEDIKMNLDVSQLRVTGPIDKLISKVAILGGSGEKYIKRAYQAGADVLITGDVSFHYAQEAEELGIVVIDAGHYIEKVMKQATSDYLKKALNSNELKFKVSEVSTDPFKFI